MILERLTPRHPGALTAANFEGWIDASVTTQAHAHIDFAPSGYLVHDLENIGSEPLCFLTVEHRTVGRMRKRPAR